MTAADRRAEVESTVRAFLARRRIPGASVGVVHRGRVVYAAGYGAADLRKAAGPPKTSRAFGFDGPVDRFAFLEREDLGAAGEERFGQLIRWIDRYKLVAGSRVICDTFEVTPQQTVARFFPEEQ